MQFCTFKYKYSHKSAYPIQMITVVDRIVILVLGKFIIHRYCESILFTCSYVQHFFRILAVFVVGEALGKENA
jgi:hypothetical protein